MLDRDIIIRFCHIYAIIACMISTSCVTTDQKTKPQDEQLAYSINSDQIITFNWDTKPGFYYVIYALDSGDGVNQKWVPLDKVPVFEGTGERFIYTRQMSPTYRHKRNMKKNRSDANPHADKIPLLSVRRFHTKEAAKAAQN